ncbi:MAG: T9SS type A sorting domain-containing protein [Saprospiraceae bacterium]|nr:T9SS type A sorting domain-containing protein [Saprospiraceae bacterium]
MKEVVAFDVHPNPASESILIKSNDNIDFVTLTTLNGVIIKSIPVKGNQVSIDLNNFVPGIVLVKVQSGANVSAKKLIIH